MEICSVINRLLQEDVAGRQRNLNIYTFAVTPLSDRCGIIEWVDNTAGIRVLIRESYVSVGTFVETSFVRVNRDLEVLEYHFLAPGIRGY